MNIIIIVLVSLAPIIIAAILNTIIMKLPWVRSINRPIDGGALYRDKKPYLGVNKTWGGTVVMTVISGLLFMLWMMFCDKYATLTSLNLFSEVVNGNAVKGLAIGLLLGAAYVVAELPNSFMKRRMDITPGTITKGRNKYWQIIIDHTDSIIGCSLVILILCQLSLIQFLQIIVICSVIHLLVNVLFVITGIKKNI